MPFNALASLFNTKQTNEARKREAELAYKRSKEDWNRQNEYNDPSAQMARLKAAGLNPNMIYGTGTAAATGSGAPASTPKYSPADQQYNIQAPDPLTMLGQYQNVQKTKADTALKWGQLGIQALQVEAKTLTIEQQRLQNQILDQTGMAIAENTVSQQEATRKGTEAATRKTQESTKQITQSIENARKQFEKMDQEIENLKQTGTNLKTANRLATVNAQIQEKYLSRWKETGIDPKSSGFLRLFGDLLSAVIKAEKGIGKPVTKEDINKIWPNQYDKLTPEQKTEIDKLINAQY